MIPLKNFSLETLEKTVEHKFVYEFQVEIEREDIVQYSDIDLPGDAALILCHKDELNTLIDLAMVEETDGHYFSDSPPWNFNLEYKARGPRVAKGGISLSKLVNASVSWELIEDWAQAFGDGVVTKYQEALAPFKEELLALGFLTEE